jgi:hypothetical protein
VRALDEMAETSLSTRRVVLEGIELDLDWRRGRGFPLASRVRAAQIPADSGLYAVVNHRSKVVRNGEATDLRARFRAHVSWHQRMRAGTAREVDYRRLRMADPHPYVVAAARYGIADFEFYVVSSDPSFRDKVFRQHVERALFRWVRLRVDLVDGNRQRSWH